LAAVVGEEEVENDSSPLREFVDVVWTWTPRLEGDNERKRCMID
jgi:hypothetical protein